MVSLVAKTSMMGSAVAMVVVGLFLLFGTEREWTNHGGFGVLLISFILVTLVFVLQDDEDEHMVVMVATPSSHPPPPPDDDFYRQVIIDRY